MKRIIVSAYAVSPIRGSECAVGWEITTRLARYFDVTVLMCETTPSNIHYYEEVKDYIKNNGQIQNLNFVPVKMPPNSKKYTLMHDNGFWPAYYWGYKCWQKEAYRIATKLHAQEKFDISYQLNMIGFREPGYLWKLNIPFVWGPTNGFHSIPISFLKSFSGKEFLFQFMKYAANMTQIRLAYRARKAAKKASIVWCVDDAAYQKMKVWSKNAELMQETGLTALAHKQKSSLAYGRKKTLNIVCSGMITTGKAYSMVIESLLRLKDMDFHLTFLGDGPLKESLMKKAEPIKDKITWCGWVNRTEVIDRIKTSNILIHPSLKEATSMTILEALGMGVPVICHDTCGMAAVVNEKNGFKIPYLNEATSIAFITELLQDIIEDPELLNKLYETIWETTDELTWDNKVDRIAKTIESFLD